MLSADLSLQKTAISFSFAAELHFVAQSGVISCTEPEKALMHKKKQ